MKNMRPVSIWAAMITVAAVGLVGGFRYFRTEEAPAAVHAEAAPPTDSVSTEDDETTPQVTVLSVQAVHPYRGTNRLSTQPGSIQAYESVRLYAKVPGFLKWQNVDIGDPVKKGERLAVVDVPEIETQVQRTAAIFKQAQKRVYQMRARVNSAKSDLDAAQAAVTQAEASAKSAAAWVRFRAKQYERMKDLFTLKSIEERLVDESKERYAASVETEQAAQATILTSKAHVVAANSKIEVAEADVTVAESEVDVAKAEFDKYKVQLAFATVIAPFDGVVTQRASFVGDFVRSANEGGEPLLTVQRVDKMRVIVQLPDRDVPYADPGDPAIVEIDALGRKTLKGTISRIAKAEDTQTRLMRIEIDLPNPLGELCHGMYGKVTITLDKSAKQLAIPSACLVGKAEDGKGSVYVIRDEHAQLVTVDLAVDNGLRVTVLSGLQPNDAVILYPSRLLYEGRPVHATILDDVSKAGSDH